MRELGPARGDEQASVVVPTYNRREGVQAVVRAALADPATSEVVVVVDGALNGTLEALEALARDEPRLRPVWIESVGASAARQVGVERARHEVVVLLDDDVLPHPGLIAGHLDWHRAERGLVVVGYMPVEVSGRWPSDVTAGQYSRWYEERCELYDENPRNVLLDLWGGNLSLRREDALRVPFDNPAFTATYHEDKEHGIRLLKAGLRGVFDRRLRATHLFSRPLAVHVNDAVQGGRGLWLCHAMHPDVLPPLTLEFWRMESLPAAVIGLVGIGQRPRARRLVRPLVLAARALGALGAYRLQSRVVRIARDLLALRGALEASQGVDRSVVFDDRAPRIGGRGGR